MAYDEDLADRIRSALKRRRGISEKKMFGGLCILVNGNMAFGIVGNELMVRVGPKAHPDALAERHAREMDFTGRSMKGMVYVAPMGFHTEEALRAWIERGIRFARSLPAKPK